MSTGDEGPERRPTFLEKSDFVWLLEQAFDLVVPLQRLPVFRNEDGAELQYLRLHGWTLSYIIRAQQTAYGWP